MVDEELRAFTVRVHHSTYVSAKAFAAMTEITLGELINQALVEYMAEHGAERHLDALLAETRAKFRDTIDRDG